MAETTESASWPVLVLAEDDDEEPPEPRVLLKAVTMAEMLRRLLESGSDVAASMKEFPRRRRPMLGLFYSPGPRLANRNRPSGEKGERDRAEPSHVAIQRGSLAGVTMGPHGAVPDARRAGLDQADFRQRSTGNPVLVAMLVSLPPGVHRTRPLHAHALSEGSRDGGGAGDRLVTPSSVRMLDGPRRRRHRTVIGGGPSLDPSGRFRRFDSIAPTPAILRLAPLASNARTGVAGLGRTASRHWSRREAGLRTAPRIQVQKEDRLRFQVVRSHLT